MNQSPFTWAACLGSSRLVEIFLNASIYLHNCVCYACMFHEKALHIGNAERSIISSLCHVSTKTLAILVLPAKTYMYTCCIPPAIPYFLIKVRWNNYNNVEFFLFYVLLIVAQLDCLPSYELSIPCAVDTNNGRMYN